MAEARKRRADPLWLGAACSLAFFAYFCAFLPWFVTTVPHFDRQLDRTALVAAAAVLVVLAVGSLWLAPASRWRCLAVAGLALLTLAEATGLLILLLNHWFG